MTEDLLSRVRAELPPGAIERKMFGGVCFMLEGNMVAGVSPRGLLVRVGKEGHAAALARGSARSLMAGREMQGYVVVDPAALATRQSLRSWLDLALAFVRTLPPKASKARTK
ncbi:MAG: TfoX/Sxy family protein [Bauldia sp.]|nr:TfoX/Sxy family protein [Bauldia sp.]